jgi:hypothetical protein
MRKALICTMGLAVVLLWATRGAAHGRAFSGVGVGAPVRSFIGVSHSRVFFHTGFGVPVHPGAFFHTGFGVPVHPGAFFHTGFGVPAHPGAFFHTGFGVPAHPGAFFHTGFGVPVHPGVVAPRVLVAPAGFVTIAPSSLGPQRGFVITPPIVIGPRALVTAPHVSMHVAPQTVVVLHPVRRAPPVFVTAPRARFVSPAVIVLTPQTTSGARTAKRANTSVTSLGS